jgi:threonine dehydratase
VERGCKRLITASGGNTGMAVARSGQVLQVPVTIFIPTSTPPMIIDLLRAQGAEVEVFGDNFGQANAKAVEVAKQPGNSYIHPYYHEETW